MPENNSKQKQQRSSSHNYQYYFVVAAVANAIAGIVHLYIYWNSTSVYILYHPEMRISFKCLVSLLGTCATTLNKYFFRQPILYFEVCIE
jgi:hypothetical protein